MNLALLALAPAALAGLAAACFLLEWTRAASAALPGLHPAGGAALPGLLLALAAGAAAGGRSATRAGRGPLAGAMRWLAAAAAATIVAVWALDAWLPTSGELVLEGAERLALATLPAAPALFLLGGAWMRLSSARQARGLPAGRALGGVLAASAVGAAPCLLLAPGWVADAAPLLRWSATALLGAALACAALAAFEEPVATAEHERSTAQGRGFAPGLLAALVGACVATVVHALLRFAWQRSGADFTSSTQLLALLAAGVALGAAAASGLARPERWLPWALLAVAPVALLVGPLEPRLAAGLLGLALGAAIALAAGSVNGDARGAAWALACACAGLALGALAGDRLTLARWGSGELLRATALVAALAALAGGARAGSWLARGAVLLPAAALALVAWTRPAPALPWRAESGDGELVEQLEDPRGTLTLVSTSDGGTRRELDGWTLPGGTAGAVAARRMARLSAAMAPDAQSALLVGAGDGQMLLGLDELLPGRVECIEPLGSLVDLARAATPPAGVTLAPPEHADPRATVAGRAAVWDLVVVGPQPPGRQGQGETLSLEHWLALRRALRPGGVAVQWLPLHQMSWPAFASAAQSFYEAFPDTRVLLASLRAPEPLVALVGGSKDLPGAERLDAFLATAPSAAGISGAADVFDLYVCDGWTLGGRIRSAPASTLAQPLAELLSARHEDQAVPLAVMNLRLLADLATPLDTVSLRARPVSEKEAKTLGAELVARSSAQRWLLVALAARLERQSAAAGALSADERGALEDEQGAALLAAWAAAPGHADVAQALLGFAAELVAARRWAAADALLATAAATQADGRLLGLRAGVLIELDQVEEALSIGRQAREAAPKDPNTLVNLGRALLLTAQDDEARDVLRAAREAFAPTPLPPLHAACLALLEGAPDARSRAQALLAQIPAGESWAAVLRRLLGE